MRSSLAEKRPLIIGAIALLCAGGVGLWWWFSQDHTRANIQGVVLYAGLPATAEVQCQPIDEKGKPQGRPAFGNTQSDGSYRVWDATTDGRNIAGVSAATGHVAVTVTVHPLERGEGELDYRSKFKVAKVLRFERAVQPGKTLEWNFWVTD